MYQYGNVARKYQQETRRKPKSYIRKSVQQLPSKKSTQKQAAKPQRKTRTWPATQPRRSRIPGFEKLCYFTAVLLVVGTLTALMMNNAALTQTHYEIQASQQEINVLQDQNAHLEREVLSLSAPERILHIAQNELGMKSEQSKVKIMTARSR